MPNLDIRQMLDIDILHMTEFDKPSIPDLDRPHMLDKPEMDNHSITGGTAALYARVGLS
jgi:hypothetical protein